MASAAWSLESATVVDFASTPSSSNAMSGITVTLPKPCTHIPLCWVPKEAWDGENVVSPNVVKLFALGVVLAGWEDSPTGGFMGPATGSDEQAAPNSSVATKHAKGNILFFSNSASCELVIIKA